MGNVCWAIYLIVVVYYTSNSVAESTGFFLAARFAGFLMLFAYLLATRKLRPADMKRLKRPNLAAVVSGLFDGLWQVSIALYTIFQFVALGSAIVALEPAIVAILGIVAYRERLTSLQLFGLIVSVGAAAALNFV